MPNVYHLELTISHTAKSSSSLISPVMQEVRPSICFPFTQEVLPKLYCKQHLNNYIIFYFELFQNYILFSFLEQKYVTVKVLARRCTFHAERLCLTPGSSAKW